MGAILRRGGGLMAPTMMARCGTCTAPMVLRKDKRGWRYVCACGVETAPRATAKLAAEDVVWVPVPPVKRAAREG